MSVLNCFYNIVKNSSNKFVWICLRILKIFCCCTTCIVMSVTGSSTSLHCISKRSMQAFNKLTRSLESGAIDLDSWRIFSQQVNDILNVAADSPLITWECTWLHQLICPRVNRMRCLLTHKRQNRSVKWTFFQFYCLSCN